MYYHDYFLNSGIAFDQGQNLNSPELIPFRLTRDIEDGMGIFSIDGIFRRYRKFKSRFQRQSFSEIV